MVTCYCGISTVFWGFLFHGRGWSNLFFLNNYPAVERVFPLLCCSGFMPVLHSILLSMGSSLCRREARFNAVVVSCLCLERQSLPGAEKWSLRASWSQAGPCWFNSSDSSVLIQESKQERHQAVWKLSIPYENKNKIIYPTLIPDTENQDRASPSLWMWFC